MTTEIPQHHALPLQLAAFAGNETRQSLFEIRWKLARGGMGRDFIALQEIDRAVRSIRNRGQMTDVFVGVAPRQSPKGTLEAIERVWCLWADLDSPDATAALNRFEPAPSIIVRSGGDGCAHAYWPLSEPLPPAWAKRANLRLAHALGGDRNATDAARIMRPAATWSYKYEPRRPVICTRLELDVFTGSQVVGHLRDEPRRQERSRATVLPGRPTAGSLDGLERTVRNAPAGQRNALLYWAACRAHEEFSAGRFSHDEAEQRLREAALAAGLTEHEVEATLRSGLDAAPRAAA